MASLTLRLSLLASLALAACSADERAPPAMPPATGQAPAALPAATEPTAEAAIALQPFTVPIVEWRSDFCNIETIELAGPDDGSEPRLHARGWLLQPPIPQVPSTWQLVLMPPGVDQGWSMPLGHLRSRPDLAVAGEPAPDAGFVVDASVAALPSGRYRVVLLNVASTAGCDNGRTVELGGNG
jgi:hypothetical protein